MPIFFTKIGDQAENGFFTFPQYKTELRGQIDINLRNSARSFRSFDKVNFSRF
jgi:hypothetical protein